MIEPPSLSPVPGGNHPVHRPRIRHGRVKSAEALYREQPSRAKFTEKMGAGEAGDILQGRMHYTSRIQRGRIVGKTVAGIQRMPDDSGRFSA